MVSEAKGEIGTKLKCCHSSVAAWWNINFPGYNINVFYKIKNVINTLLPKVPHWLIYVKRKGIQKSVWNDCTDRVKPAFLYRSCDILFIITQKDYFYCIFYRMKKRQEECVSKISRHSCNHDWNNDSNSSLITCCWFTELSSTRRLSPWEGQTQRNPEWSLVYFPLYYWCI